MVENIKAYSMFKELYCSNSKFKECVLENFLNGKMRFFGEDEWSKIVLQNFISPIPEMKEFLDMFVFGYNIGNCIGASRQLSYSYRNVDIVSGVLPMIKGTLNAEEEGGHGWLETPDYVIDTSLMLVFDKSLKEDLGYIEEQRITSSQLRKDQSYQARKDFVLDRSLMGNKDISVISDLIVEDLEDVVGKKKDSKFR